MREDGFYWVKSFGDWFVAEWKFGAWWIPGNEVEQNDSYFTEISKNKLIKPSDIKPVHIDTNVLMRRYT